MATLTAIGTVLLSAFPLLIVFLAGWYGSLPELAVEQFVFTIPAVPAAFLAGIAVYQLPLDKQRKHGWSGGLLAMIFMYPLFGILNLGGRVLLSILTDGPQGSIENVVDGIFFVLIWGSGMALGAFMNSWWIVLPSGAAAGYIHERVQA